MVDSRFYRPAGHRPVSELLAASGHGDLWTGQGDDLMVAGVGELDKAGPADIAFVASDKFARSLAGTQAGVVLAAPGMAAKVPAGRTIVACAATQIVFAEVAAALYPAAVQAWVAGSGPPPQLEQGVQVGPNATIGPGAEIGAGSVIGANASIGPGVVVGRGCSIGANCTVEYTIMGDGVVINPGTSVGVSGFGYLPHEGRLVPVPQLGRVVLADRVEIGANTVIDRGALGDTEIGEGSKIGSQILISHNCRIGRNCMLVGFTALAGSVVVEDDVIILGGGGTTGHVTIGEGTLVYGGSWVGKNIPPHSKVIGSPAEDTRVAAMKFRAIRKLIEDTTGDH